MGKMNFAMWNLLLSRIVIACWAFFRAIRKMARRSDVVMSVCTGAFTLAKTGLLNGKQVTTHHDAWGSLGDDFPLVTVQSNRRYVQSGPGIFTSGGLTAGIDLALHIVELYFGREVAENTAKTMEYEGGGWKGDGSSSVKYEDGMKAMKMENVLRADRDGVVKKIHARTGDSLPVDAVILEFA